MQLHIHACNMQACADNASTFFFLPAISLDAKQESSNHAGHEQVALRQARPNPLHALRGVVDALELRAKIVHLQTLLVTQTDEQTRSAILDMIEELERRISFAEAAVGAEHDTDRSSHS
jgi:hypothetical protein